MPEVCRSFTQTFLPLISSLLHVAVFIVVAVAVVAYHCVSSYDWKLFQRDTLASFD